jgi:hypothetical protein
MQGGATQAMLEYIVEERQHRRCPRAVGTQRAHGDCGTGSGGPARFCVARRQRCASTSPPPRALNSRWAAPRTQIPQAPCARRLLILGQAPEQRVKIWGRRLMCPQICQPRLLDGDEALEFLEPVLYERHLLHWRHLTFTKLYNQKSLPIRPQVPIADQGIHLDES